MNIIIILLLIIHYLLYNEDFLAPDKNQKTLEITGYLSIM